MPDDDKDPPEGEGKTFTQDDLEREIGKRLARERAKYAGFDDLKAKAEKLDELEAANKTETQRLEQKLADAEKRAQDAESRALRFEVASSKGLTAAQAKRLVGATKEELEADADELVDTFKPADKGGETDESADEKPSPTNRPEPALRGGGDPTQDGGHVDIRKVVADIPRS